LDECYDFLLLETSICFAIFALSIGEFVVAADISRDALKKSPSDPQLWTIRALSFAGIGWLLFVVS